MMPITMAKSGDNVVIQKITGSDKIRQHLAVDIKDFSDTWIQS